MRKFIVSDIHGFGNFYYSVMSYLDNISKNENIELYINGDLIDRGLESAEILLDIKKRVNDNKFKIIYLGGNHELMMYQFYLHEKRNRKIILNDWYLNGGMQTLFGLEDLLNNNKSEIYEVVNFISNLKIYHMFEEKIGNKPIVLVHAACIDNMKNVRDMMIKDNNSQTSYAVWTREHNIYDYFWYTIINPNQEKIGHREYFTIVGHTPVNNKYGFEYHENQNYLNIDGGCACYVAGTFSYNHFPLVEVCDNYLKLLTFNSNNEIVYGNYFDGKKSTCYTKEELEEARVYLNHDVKIKKLSINEDGICSYW